MSRRRRPIFSKRRGRVRRPAPATRIEPVAIKRLTGFAPADWPASVSHLRAFRYRRDERTVGGDAPKDFVWVYSTRPGGIRPAKWRTWDAYIAKVGHQYYPAESITEQLISRVGQLCGLKMADSRLMVCAQQIRFLSRYFLAEGEILNHGAEILSGYLADKKFVDGIAGEKAEKDLFTFQVFCTAIHTSFPNEYQSITQGFVRMIGFDALVGNQDRHFYNWGVITHPTGRVAPCFAPIYDTARGLFWNDTEERLKKYEADLPLVKYVKQSRPQIGWDGWDAKKGELGHFEFVRCICNYDSMYRRYLEDLSEVASRSLEACLQMVDAEFGEMLSASRRGAIKRCLRLRFESFEKAI